MPLLQKNNSHGKGQKELKFQINSALELGSEGRTGVQVSVAPLSHDFNAKYSPLAMEEPDSLQKQSNFVFIRPAPLLQTETMERAKVMSWLST